MSVTCVERGRWGYTSSAFVSSRTSSHYHLRAMVSGQASESYRFADAPISDQAKLWSEVSRKLEAMDSPSSSDAMQDLYRNYAVKLGELEQKFSAPADCNAAAFVIAGRIIGTDFFDKADTLRKLWQKLIRSCSIDALELATKAQNR